MEVIVHENLCETGDQKIMLRFKVLTTKLSSSSSP